jgi:hypothetical protein
VRFSRKIDYYKHALPVGEMGGPSLSIVKTMAHMQVHTSERSIKNEGYNKANILPYTGKHSFLLYGRQ